ncbi:autophagy-related protein 22-like protein [Lophiotrema nucula]|uniref:Autophagy-related protein n=1 Tax=Lophiotrema nucula TaxID=690887 RepID=A0A6A5YSM5_9PLEO|nr:autophagy-related protein 22-like protein [Lophiotrema nucula]
MAVADVQPRYKGEDNRPTSSRELWGWYSYGLAAEVFTLAREVGVLQLDKTKPCVLSPDSASNTHSLARRDENQCIVNLFGYELNTSSFTLYSFSLAIVVQTLVLISIGAIADYGSNRKRLLLVLSFTGSTACMLFIFVYPGIYMVGLFLTVVSVASLGSSFVLLNSFLPLLVANDPSIRDRAGPEPVPLHNFITTLDNRDLDEDDDDDDNDNDEDRHEDPLEDPLEGEHDTSRLLNDQVEQDTRLASDTISPMLELSNSISSKGIGIGYAASVLVQCISISIFTIYTKIKASGWASASTMPLRTVLFFVGLWWASFTVPTALWLRRRPGLPLPWKTGETSPSSIVSALRYIAFAWVSLWRTIKTAVRLRQVLIFLLGWFLLSDGIATITGTAILFAKTELQLGAAAIALLSITATVSGIIGATCWSLIGRTFGLKSISIVLSCILLFELIPLYGLLGFIPFFKSLGVIGLQQWWEIYPLGFLLGFIMGGISSYCRSIFGSLIPPGREAAFYALYAVTDKGSSVIGPAVVGRIIDVTGSIRMGFWFLSILMISPAPFFWFVDVEKGRLEALMMAKQMKGSGTERAGYHAIQ